MTGADGFAAFGSILGVFVVILLIFVGAYYFTKFMGKHYSLQVSSSSEIRVIDKLALSRDHYLLIVETGHRALLVGVSPQRIDTLAELDSEAFADLPPVQANADFISLLRNRLRKPDTDADADTDS